MVSVKVCKWAVNLIQGDNKWVSLVIGRKTHLLSSTYQSGVRRPP